MILPRSTSYLKLSHCLASKIKLLSRSFPRGGGGVTSAYLLSLVSLMLLHLFPGQHHLALPFPPFTRPSLLWCSVYVSAVQKNFLQWWKCSPSVQVNTVTTTFMWLSGTWDVASVMEELNFKILFNFNNFNRTSPRWLVAIVSDSTGLSFCLCQITLWESVHKFSACLILEILPAPLNLPWNPAWPLAGIQSSQVHHPQIGAYSSLKTS